MRTAKVPLAVETGANLEVQPLLPGKVREHLSRAAIGRGDGRHQSDGVEHGGKLEQRVEHGDAKPPAAGALMNGDLPHEHGFRSEEHTSELQSLMRSSYAVFCLKKKKQEKMTTTNRQTTNASNIKHS